MMWINGDHHVMKCIKEEHHVLIWIKGEHHVMKCINEELYVVM